MEKIRWGILGCGKIAKKFATDLQLVKDGALIAIGSRSKENADKFASEFPVRDIHYSYEALMQNKEVDVIYIATPHGLHHEHVLLCLQHHKAIVCEKAFALNTRQATEMIELARRKKVFLMEALWTKFMPHYQLLMQWLKDGKLGSIQNVLINFGFAPSSPVPQRMFDPLLGGGSLLDIGIYNVFMALSVLGKPDFVDACMTPASTGIDEQCSVVFRYKDGAIANLFSSFSTNLATEADISGRKGRIRLTNRFYEPSTTMEYYPDKIDSKEIILYDKEPGWGYQYEIKHVHECLQKGLIESPVMSHADTLLLMETLDRIRLSAGIHYQVDRL